jgi:peptidoglycan/LPS O-acetylase OafA/YrhL
MKIKKHLSSLVLLRGIAALAVCFCHFGGALNNVDSVIFKIFDEYGEYGVQCFFIISGFIIPLSLYKGSYLLSDYPRFLLKRFYRLHPPYLAALMLTLLIMFGSYYTRNIDFPEDVFSIFKASIYLRAPADNPVFWTLRVEAEYYLFIGVFYLILLKNMRFTYLVFMPIILIISQVFDIGYIKLIPFIAYFFVGFLLFLIYFNLQKKKEIYFILFLYLLFIFIFYGFTEGVTSFLTVSFILFYDKSIPNIFNYFGKISYSLYLIHFPIGIKFINLSKQYVPNEYQWMLFFAALGISIFTAHIFYLIFEKFSDKLSKKIKYNNYKKSNATLTVSS